MPAELVHALQTTRGTAELADITASVLDAEIVEKQALLETRRTPPNAWASCCTLLSHRIEVLRLSQEIGERTKEQLDDRQRKYLLREQLKTIQKELGENGGEDEELARLEEPIAKAGMPADIEAQARKELERLQGMPDALRRVLRCCAPTWSGWSSCPGRRRSRRPSTWRRRARTLEADHFGLEKVKQRIVEYLAVRKLNPEGRAPILCFVGPPGRGQDVARAEHRAGAAAPVHPRVAGRRARRGRDPRPPPHLHRRDARPHHPGPAQGRRAQPA